MVYSTDTDRACPKCRRFMAHCNCKSAGVPNSGDGIVRLFRETKGRKGKGVTLIKGLTIPLDELTALAKTLKSSCGVGGAIKTGVIELQTADREKVKLLLVSAGYSVKIAGG